MTSNFREWWLGPFGLQLMPKVIIVWIWRLMICYDWYVMPDGYKGGLRIDWNPG